MKDEVWECLRHCSHVRDVMPHHGVGDGERGSGTIGEVTHHQTICGVRGWGGGGGGESTGASNHSRHYHKSLIN